MGQATAAERKRIPARIMDWYSLIYKWPEGVRNPCDPFLFFCGAYKREQGAFRIVDRFAEQQRFALGAPGSAVAESP